MLEFNIYSDECNTYAESNSRVGLAVCAEDDEYQYVKGAKIAILRSYIDPMSEVPPGLKGLVKVIFSVNEDTLLSVLHQLSINIGYNLAQLGHYSISHELEKAAHSLPVHLSMKAPPRIHTYAPTWFRERRLTQHQAAERMPIFERLQLFPETVKTIPEVDQLLQLAKVRKGTRKQTTAKIDAIKAVRSLDDNIGLKAAKEYVEAYIG